MATKLTKAKISCRAKNPDGIYTKIFDILDKIYKKQVWSNLEFQDSQRNYFIVWHKILNKQAVQELLKIKNLEITFE